MQPGNSSRYPLALEAFRQMAGQQASSAGIQGGAPVANAQTSQNPMAAMARMRVQGAGQAPGVQVPQPGGSQPPTQPAMDSLDQVKEGEANKIVAALIKRLISLSPAEGQIA